MLRQVVADFRGWGFLARAAVADTIGAAWAVTRTANGPLIVPPGRSAQALARLPVQALRISANVVEVLHSLGLSTIGHVAALPRETLPSRFGPELLRRLDQALGEIPEPLVPERPEEPIEAAYGCEPPLENRAAIEIILQRLLERVMKPLERRNAGILQLDIELTVSGHEPTRFTVGLVRPSLDSKRLRELLRLQLERVQLRGRLAGATLRVVRTCASGCRPVGLVRVGRTSPRPPGSRFAPQPVEQSSRPASCALSAPGSRLSARTGRRVRDPGGANFSIQKLANDEAGKAGPGREKTNNKRTKRHRLLRARLFRSRVVAAAAVAVVSRAGAGGGFFGRPSRTSHSPALGQSRSTDCALRRPGKNRDRLVAFPRRPPRLLPGRHGRWPTAVVVPRPRRRIVVRSRRILKGINDPASGGCQPAGSVLFFCFVLFCFLFRVSRSSSLKNRKNRQADTCRSP